MGNIGINNQYTPVAKPSIVRLKMNNGVDNGAGIPPSVQFGKTEGGRSLAMKPLTTYNLPKPGGADGAPSPDLSGPRLKSFGGLNAANGEQLGNKAVFNLYEMVSLMITLSNSLNKTFREQMAARVVGEISKLHDEARTLTNAAYTARTMGIVSAVAGGTLGAMSLGGTIATGVASKNAQAASGLDAASKNLDAANREMKPLQDFTKAQDGLNSRSADVLDRALEKTFTGQEGKLQGGDIATQLEEKTKAIRTFEDNEKAIGDLQGQLDADNALKGKAPGKVEQVEQKDDNVAKNVLENEDNEEEIIKNNSKNDIKNVNNDGDVPKKEGMSERNNPDIDESLDEGHEIKRIDEDPKEVKNEKPQGLTDDDRDQISKKIDSLKKENAELDAKYDIREQYGDNPSEAYGQELNEQFAGFDAEIDGSEALKGHPFDRKAVKEAGAKWLERQDAILKGGTDRIEGFHAQAKMEFGRSQDIYKGMMEGSWAASFAQASAGMGQGLIPVLQLLTGGAGVNELANAQTKDLQAGERADNYNAGEMQAMKDGLKGIVDGALQVMSTAVSSYAQFQNTVNSNFRA